ncbi:hypothetical protein BaRGS_00027855 [Batillaria attramentaria]|uniref:Uncharacterized protein n=1 Tax=Batillaria attramentaria TaxID=370345 RepID=A0ABD0K1D6_9CAEN
MRVHDSPEETIKTKPRSFEILRSNSWRPHTDSHTQASKVTGGATQSALLYTVHTSSPYTNASNRFAFCSASNGKTAGKKQVFCPSQRWFPRRAG